MRIALRSLAFNGAFYSWTFICAIVFLPALLLPRTVILKIAQIWVSGINWLCLHILGLHFKIVGQERLVHSPAIFALKHQSAWETIICYALFEDPSIVLKRDLLRIPFFGWYLRKLDMIPLSRSKKNAVKDLKTLLKAADQAIAQGRPLIIFPEGTRSKPGQKSTYHSGVASLYLHLNIPVIPIAHNAGLYWPRRGFLRYPGCITLAFLKPIQPGLSRQEFMRTLEQSIEGKMQELIPHS